MAKKELSTNEQLTLKCGAAGCGYQAPSVRGLKSHKSRSLCWDKEAAPQEELQELPAEIIERAEEVAIEVKADAPKEVEPEFVQEPASDLPDLPPRELGLTEIPVGSELSLSGAYCRLDPASGAYVVDKDELGNPVSLEELPSIIVDKFESDGASWLKVQGKDSSFIWVMPEQVILDSTGMLKKLYKEPVEAPVEAPVDVPAPFVPSPEQVLPETQEAPVEAPVEVKEDSLEEIAERQSYIEAVSNYYAAKELKNTTNNNYTAIDKDTRDTILEYLKKHGSESEEGKKDDQLTLKGYQVLFSYTEGSTYLERDDEQVIEWLKVNFPFCLKPSIDEDQWKWLKEQGLVPAEFILKVEEEKQRKADRRLYVTKEEETNE